MLVSKFGMRNGSSSSHGGSSGTEQQ
jgi:hypothetical protein